jgi:hypothetical protein
VIADGTKVTRDLNRDHGVGTVEMTDAIVDQLKNRT